MKPPRGRYTEGHDEPVLRSHVWRTANNSAAYLLPYLVPGMALLDAGCGPGTITVDLAALVSPGEVVAVDSEPDVLRHAEVHAVLSGYGDRITFAVGDAHALEYPDDTFDVVHAHEVLQHVDDPVQALREMKRVCKPGGIVAARDCDYRRAQPRQDPDRRPGRLRRPRRGDLDGRGRPPRRRRDGATLYRNFPGRQELLEALYNDEVDALCDAAEAGVGADGARTPGAALTAWLHRLFASIPGKRLIVSELLEHADPGSPVIHGNRARALAAGRPLLAAAQQAHEIRDDLTIEQIFDMIVAIAKIHGDPAYLEPMLQTMLDGLRPA
jgi:SAM-dependent methyltransferase